MKQTQELWLGQKGTDRWEEGRKGNRDHHSSQMLRLPLPESRETGENTALATGGACESAYKSFKVTCNRPLNVKPWNRGEHSVAHWPNLPCHLCFYGLQAKNGFFYFLSGKKQQQKRLIFGTTWKVYEIQISVDISTLLVECSHTALFTCCLRPLSCYINRAGRLWHRRHGESRHYSLPAPYQTVCLRLT